MILFNAALAQEKNEEEVDPITPPAPIIVKKNPDAIAIPPEAVSAIGKYQERAISTNARIGSSFGYRRDPFTRRARFHSGLDIKAAHGDPVAASLAGTVQFAGWYHGYGNWVVIDHGGGVTTHYAHLSSFAVEQGQKVARGTVVGYAGRTGRATSPHLHYEVRIDGNPVDPLQAVALDADSAFFKSAPAPKGEPVEDTTDSSADVRTPPPALRNAGRCSM
jgi:murein DD-endopeptidase MepM/ murein hydrolase activator NlpD